MTDDLDGMRFNTAIAAMMEFTNHLTKLDVRPRSVLEPFVLLIAPFAPHLAEELWCALGGAARMSRILSSPVTMWICIAYLLFSFCVTLTWHIPQLSFLMPKRLEQWMYPITKTDLDVLRFAHFWRWRRSPCAFCPGIGRV